MVAEGDQVALAVIERGAVGDRLGDDLVEAVGIPHLADGGEVAGIDDELGARTRPVAEHVGQVVTGGADQDAGLEVLVADRAVLDRDAGLRLELLEDLGDALLAEIAGEVVRDGDDRILGIGGNGGDLQPRCNDRDPRR